MQAPPHTQCSTTGYKNADIAAAAITQPHNLSLSAVAPGIIAMAVIANIAILNHNAMSPNPEGLAAIPYAPVLDKAAGSGLVIVGAHWGRPKNGSLTYYA